MKKEYLAVAIIVIAIILASGIYFVTLPTPTPIHHPIPNKVAAICLIPAKDGGFCEALHRSLFRLINEGAINYTYLEKLSLGDAKTNLSSALRNALRCAVFRSGFDGS